MAGEKFLKEVGGQVTEIIATQTGGAGNEDLIPSLNASGQIDITMLPTGIGADTASIIASENLSGGDFVNIWNDGGVVKIRKAIAEDGKLADGFVLDPVTSPAEGTVYFEGKNTSLSGLTLAAVYYLSDSTAGEITATAPSASTKHVQRIGKAYATTTVTTEGLAYGSIKKA
jgi:hypothetical protein